MSKSIYEYISENIAEGRLPENFSLPVREEDRDKIKFACGAWDGIMMYHFGCQPEDRADELVSALGSDNVSEAVEAALGDKSVLMRCDALQRQIRDEKVFAPDELYKIAVGLIKNSPSSEAVKAGLSLLELLITEGRGEVRDILHTLGVCDEFTLWCCYILRHYSDGNEEIFRLAQRVGGWGKVFAVKEFLEPRTPEIRRWLLCHGCDNDIHYGYLGETVYVKAGIGNMLAERLPESFDDEEVHGLAAIALGLTDEGPMAGASALDDPEKALHSLRRVLELHSGEELIDRAVAAIDSYELPEE